MTAGALDTSFNGTGTVLTTTNSGSGGDLMAVAVEYVNDANYLKTVVVGTATVPQGKGSQSVYAVMRYDTNGMLDSTFGNNGEVDIAATYGTSNGASVQEQADGKIVIACGAQFSYGKGKNAVTREDLMVVRLNSNGSLDTTFNKTGTAILDIPGENIDACGLAILPDGQIVVGGSTTNETGFLVARWNANGTLDTTFGPNGQGYGTTSTGQAFLGNANEMALEASGNILLVGQDSRSGHSVPSGGAIHGGRIAGQEFRKQWRGPPQPARPERILGLRGWRAIHGADRGMRELQQPDGRRRPS